jgi:hypothetical protein
MSLSVTKRPERLVSGERSYWIAAHNPVIFEITTEGIDPGSVVFNKIEVYEKDSNTLLIQSIHRVMGLPAGKATVDISYVKNYLDPKYSNPTGINKKDDKATLAVYIIVRELYLINGLFVENAVLNDESNVYYLTKSVKQAGDLYGQNMGEYVPIPKNNIKAKFLTRFKNPRYYPGYTNTISFIYSETLSGVEVKRVEVEKDLNKVLLNTSETQLDRSQIKNINHLALSNYSADRKYVDVYLQTGAAAPDAYVETGYVTEGFVL